MVIEVLFTLNISTIQRQKCHYSWMIDVVLIRISTANTSALAPVLEISPRRIGDCRLLPSSFPPFHEISKSSQQDESTVKSTSCKPLLVAAEPFHRANPALQ